MCDHRGVLVNDPVVLKFEDELYWLSIADNNMLIWSRAIAEERGLKVEICEPDVSPLAIQAPNSDEVAAALFGDWVREALLHRDILERNSPFPANFRRGLFAAFRVL